MNKFCTSCGAALEEGQQFCGKCGKPVQGSDTPESQGAGTKAPENSNYIREADIPTHKGILWFKNIAALISALVGIGMCIYILVMLHRCGAF